jgi:hypothetical protein
MFLKGLNLLAALLLAAEYGSAQDAPALRYNVKLQREYLTLLLR